MPFVWTYSRHNFFNVFIHMTSGAKFMSPFKFCPNFYPSSKNLKVCENLKQFNPPTLPIHLRKESSHCPQSLTGSTFSLLMLGLCGSVPAAPAARPLRAQALAWSTVLRRQSRHSMPVVNVCLGLGTLSWRPAELFWGRLTRVLPQGDNDYWWRLSRMNRTWLIILHIYTCIALLTTIPPPI